MKFNDNIICKIFRNDITIENIDLKFNFDSNKLDAMTASCDLEYNESLVFQKLTDEYFEFELEGFFKDSRIYSDKVEILEVKRDLGTLAVRITFKFNKINFECKESNLLEYPNTICIPLILPGYLFYALAPLNNLNNKISIDDVSKIYFVKREYWENFFEQNTSSASYSLEIHSNEVDNDEKRILASLLSQLSKYIQFFSFIIGYPFKLNSYLYKNKNVTIYTYFEDDSNTKENRRIHPSNFLISREKLLTFFQQYTFKFLETNDNQIDLIIPLYLYNGLNKEIIKDPDFLILFMGFESMINEYSLKEKNDRILTNNKYKKIRKLFERSLMNFELTDNEIVLIKEKLSELKKKPFRILFLETMKNLNIDTSNCEQDGKINIISIRNCLVHNPKGINKFYPIFITEFFRLQRLFELLVLRLLGYNGEIQANHFSNTLGIV